MTFTCLRKLWNSWSWRSKQQKEELENPNGDPLNPNSLLDSDTLTKSMDSSYYRRVKKQKQKSLEEKKLEKEHDVVVVPADGFSGSESESDDSDWSIGWLEPHSSITESDDSFAVLVPCYGHRSEGDKYSKGKHLPEKYSKGIADDLYGDEQSKKNVEQWFSSLKILSQSAIF
ncbi:OLC1v1036438C1 [Oldenlandia corymbosa var. corymbosa]|uniref:OLC1v1036438C1 n=1 Tax=Oldenlandia corymbosa var. corymbosa TaxID=529605 RepID=A0AAV1CVZ7_OLDCO|nr:OLC1v1036438C1 [Oldenlandia corymbosa var. corymbosa]